MNRKIKVSGLNGTSTLTDEASTLYLCQLRNTGVRFAFYRSQSLNVSYTGVWYGKLVTVLTGGQQVMFCLHYTKILVFWNMADISALEEPATAINLSHGSSVSIVT